MNDLHLPDDPKPSGSLFRDVALLLLVGTALGLSHNWFMLRNGPGKGLAWIKTERKVVRLADVMPTDPPAPLAAATMTATGTAVADTAAKAASAVATKLAEKSASKPADPKAPTAKPAAAAPATTPATTPAAAPTAPATSTPAASAPAADVPAIPESREPMETGLPIVRRLYAANAAVFVDARSAEEFAEGHIAGAYNLPFDDVFKKPDLVQKIADRGLPIVCYCGGGDCDLSRNLAFSFLDAGKKRVLVFLGGLPEWKDAALPVRTGSEP